MTKPRTKSSGIGSRKAKAKIAAETPIGKLRRIYGRNFASGFGDQVKLKSAIESKSNAATSDFHSRSASQFRGKDRSARKLSSKSATALANATVALGPALKRLADR